MAAEASTRAAAENFIVERVVLVLFGDSSGAGEIDGRGVESVATSEETSMSVERPMSKAERE